MTEQTTASAAHASKGRWLVWGFAALGVLTALAIIWLVVALNSQGNRREPALIEADKPGESYEVGSVEQLAGTNLISIEIRSANGEAGYGSIKSSGRDDVRNVLLLDRTTGESRRLLPDNRQRIADIHFLPAQAQDRDDSDAVAVSKGGADRNPTPAYYLIELIVKHRDAQTISLLVGSLSGTEQQVVMQGLDGVERRWMIDTRRLGLIVREGNALYFRVVDMIERKVLQSRKIEIG